MKLFLLLLLTVFGFSEEKLVEVKKAKLFCKVIGKGEPIVVLHGGPGLMHDYLVTGLLPLADNYQLIFYDQRGCGKSFSEINEDTMKIDLFAEDLDSLRKALGFNKITVLAHSWGGLLAMKYATVYPETMKRLILMNSLPASFEDCFLTVTESMNALSPYKDQLDAIEKSPEFLSGDSSTIEKYFKLRARPNFYDHEKVELLNVPVSLQDFNNYNQICKFLAQNLIIEGFNWYENLNTLDVPTLIVHSDSDFIPVSDAKLLHKNIPYSECVILTECGHCPFIEKPDELLLHLKGFLAR